MTWEKSAGHNSSPAQLDASAQAARDRVVADYRKTLNQLEQQIGIAKAQLQAIQNDITAEHANRLKQYDVRHKEISEQEAGLLDHNIYLNAWEARLQDAQQSFDQAVEEENKRIAANLLEFEAQQKQINDMTEELKQQKLVQDTVEFNQKVRHATLNNFQEELRLFKLDSDKVCADLIAKNHQLRVDISNHELLVQKYNEDVKTLLHDQARTKACYDELMVREAALEPLKAKYEEAIAVNAKEALRLRDENIKLFQTSKEVEVRLQVAIAAEQRAKSETDKLEALKQEIHSKITKEK